MKMYEEILKELNETIDEAELAGGDNQYDGGFRDALHMVKHRILKPIFKKYGALHKAEVKSESEE